MPRRSSWRASHSRLLTQPFPALDVDLDRIGRPALHTDMHPAEVRIDQIPVEMQALARTAHHLQAPGFAVAGHRERAARLQGREHADETFRHSILRSDPARQRLLGTARGVSADPYPH